MTATDRRSHVRPLTSLRFLAAIWVLLHHALPRGGPGTYTEAIGASGWLGVSLFFVLSGFLLTIRYAPDGTLRGPRRAFWLERLARLGPTYLLALAFALLLFLRDANSQADITRTRALEIIGAVVTLQQSWRPELACQWDCPAWSLSVEAWFYLAFPFVIAALGGWLLRDAARSRVRGALVLVVALACSALIFPWLERVGSGWVLPIYSLSPLARWPEFLAGIGLAAALRGWRPATSRPGAWLFIAGVTWISAAVSLRDCIAMWGLHLLPMSLPGFVLLVAACWALRDEATMWLDARWLVLLGEASYALYLFHAPLHGYLLAAVNRVVGRGYDTSWALFGAYVVLAVGLSVAVHLLFELPWRARLRRLFGLTARQN